jgi:Holliday junction resolvase RusA-like endonuclease
MTKRGFAYTPEKTRSYEAELKFAAVQQMQGRAPLLGPLVVTMVAIFPIAPSWPKKKQAAALAGDVRPIGKPDADNLLKTLDALNQVVWRDDSQIVTAQITKRYGATPGVTVCVEGA